MARSSVEQFRVPLRDLVSSNYGETDSKKIDLGYYQKTAVYHPQISINHLTEQWYQTLRTFPSGMN